jgi:hypothetical protein
MTSRCAESKTYEPTEELGWWLYHVQLPIHSQMPVQLSKQLKACMHASMHEGIFTLYSVQ